MAIKLLIRFSLFSLILTGFGQLAHAGETLTIKDSAGFVRAEGNIEENGKIEFDVTTESGSPADGSEVTIVNATTGESFTTYATQGKAIFDGIPAGVYTVSSPDLGLTFATVTISEGSAALGGSITGGIFGASSSTVVGGTLGAAAIAGGAIAISESDSNSDSMSPSE